MFRINFKLKKPEDVCPWGSSMHWFGLTDGLLWINAGDSVIYEYSDSAIRMYEGSSRYNDYQLSRFLEDFSELFGEVSVSVPQELYSSAENFFEMTEEWKKRYINESDEFFDRFYDNEYEPLTEWYNSRKMNSGHLVGGPNISFIRYGDRIKIIWDGRCRLENGDDLWTSPQGVYELPYSEFVNAVKAFFLEFFMKMDGQVRISCEMDWGNVQLDKQRLRKEHIQRKELFRQRLEMLDRNETFADKDRILGLFERMKGEICNN